MMADTGNAAPIPLISIEDIVNAIVALAKKTGNEQHLLTHIVPAVLQRMSDDDALHAKIYLGVVLGGVYWPE